MRKLLRGTYHTGVILLFILVAVAGFTQTRLFRSWLRDAILRSAATALHGSVTFGPIEGNLVTGFTLRDLRLTVDSLDVVSAARLEIRYDPIPFPFKRVAVTRLTLVDPMIRIWRGRDSVWNLGRIARPVPADSQPGAWTFDLRNIALVNARVEILDSVRLEDRLAHSDPPLPPDVFDYAHIELDSLQLNVSAQIARGDVMVQIHDLAFVSHAPSFILQHLRADCALTGSEVSLQRFRVETPHSRLDLGVAFHRVDIRRVRSIADFQSVPVELECLAERIDARELKQWLSPDVDFLDETFSIRLKAHGTFGALVINEAAVQAGSTVVQVAGRIDHLDRPSEIALDLFGKNCRIHPSDLLSRLPGLRMPDLRFLGDAAFSVGFVGRPSDFRGFCRLNAPAGTVEVDGTLRSADGILSYKGTIRAEEVDLAALTGSPALASRINTHIAFDGSGTDIHSMIVLVRAEIDSSLFKNQAVRSSIAVLDAADGTLHGHLLLHAGSTTIDCSGRLVIGRDDSLSYAVDGRVTSLNLADVLDRENLQSDLSFLLNAGGVHSSNAREDSARIGFLPSIIGDEPFPESVANVRLSEDANRTDGLTIRSDFCDLDAVGHFSPESLLRSVEGSVTMVTGVVRRYAEELDSLRGSSPAPRPSALARKRDSTTVDARIHAEGKDMNTLGVLLFEQMEGNVAFDGHIVRIGDSIRTEAKATADEFAWAFPRDTVVMLGSTFDLDMTGSTELRPLHSPSGTFRMEGNAFALRSAFFAGPHLDLALRPDSVRFSGAALIDSVVRLDLEGTGWMDEHTFAAHLDRVTARMGDFTLTSMAPFLLRRGSDGFFVTNAQFLHDAEQLTLDGYFDPSGDSDFRMRMRGFHLRGIQSIVRGRADIGAAERYGGVLNADGAFEGTLGEPRFVLDVDADSVQVRNGSSDPSVSRSAIVELGHVAGRMSYRERRMDLFLTLRHAMQDSVGGPALLLQGSTPFDLALRPQDRRPLEGSIDLELRSEGIDIGFLEPFVPEVTGLTGRMTCDMRMVGPVDAPVYDGTMTMRNAKFFFRPAGLRYALNADLVAAGERIEFRHTSIRNDPADGQPDGIMDIGGNFRMLGLKFRDFDLLARGPLLVMNSETRRPGQKFFGRLVIVPGPAGLHWQGNFDQSLLKGEVFVRRASLTFPPEREAETIRASRVSVAYVDDTTRTPAPVHLDPARRPLIDPFTEGGTNGTHWTAADERSFIDRIIYDVSLETQGTTQIRLVFNPQTNEELFADLQGRLYFYRTPEVAKLTGSVEVNDRSYYNFIKKFNVSQGQLLYTGDPLNPELNITAQYHGEHRDTLSSQGGRVQKVIVTLNITGTRNEPKPKMSLEVDNKKRNTGEEESDALSFILSGQFRDELTDQQRTGLIGTNFGFGLASGMLTGPLSEMLRRQTGFIQSVDVMYYGGSSFNSSADVRLTGQVGEAVIRLGGRVLSDPVNNTNASVELPMSSITGNMQLRNLILTLERRVDGIETLDDRRRPSNGARLYYRFSF